MLGEPELPLCREMWLELGQGPAVGAFCPCWFWQAGLAARHRAAGALSGVPRVAVTPLLGDRCELRAGPSSPALLPQPRPAPLPAKGKVSEASAKSLQCEECWWKGLPYFLNPFSSQALLDMVLEQRRVRMSWGRAVPGTQHSYPAALGCLCWVVRSQQTPAIPSPLHSPALLQELDLELLLSGVMPGLGISTFRSEKIVFIFPCFTVEFPGDAIEGTWLHFQFSFLAMLAVKELFPVSSVNFIPGFLGR